MMDVFTVSFFGHRRLNDSFAVEHTLEKMVCERLRQKVYIEFLVGRDGEYCENHYHLAIVSQQLCTSNRFMRKLGISSHRYDLHSGFDIMNCEIPERPEFIFWHPPYWDIVTYSDVMYKADEVQKKYSYGPKQYDLSCIPDRERWRIF